MAFKVRAGAISGNYSVSLRLSLVYRRCPCYSTSVRFLLICLLLHVGLSQEPRRRKGNLFFHSHNTKCFLISPQNVLLSTLIQSTSTFIFCSDGSWVFRDPEELIYCPVPLMALGPLQSQGQLFFSTFHIQGSSECVSTLRFRWNISGKDSRWMMMCNFLCISSIDT